MAVSIGPKIPVMSGALLGDSYLSQGNAMLRMLQALIQANVINVNINTPPSSPSDGDTYVVGTAPSGAWVGQAKSLAYWSMQNPAFPSGEWEFYTPLTGWVVSNQNDLSSYTFSGTNWAKTNNSADVVEVNGVTAVGTAAFTGPTGPTGPAGTNGTPTPAGGDTQIQYNHASALGADANLDWDYTNKVLHVTGSGTFDSSALNTTGLTVTGPSGFATFPYIVEFFATGQSTHALYMDSSGASLYKADPGGTANTVQLFSQSTGAAVVCQSPSCTVEMTTISGQPTFISATATAYFEILGSQLQWGAAGFASQDTGLSRIASKTLGIGSVASGDTSGTLTCAKIIENTSFTPASSSAAGTIGQIAWDSSFIYICIATNTWKRVAIATW